MSETPGHGPSSLRKSKQGWSSSKKLAPIQDASSPTHLPGLSTTKQIQHKKELVEAVRRINPASCQSAPAIFWNVDGSLKTAVIDDGGVKQQLNIVENGVNAQARRFNDLRVSNERLTRELKLKLDELHIEKKNFDALDAMKKAETAEAQRIELLQHEISKVEEDIARRMHYTRVLQHMLLRLKKNQLRFDAHMAGMEEVMKTIQKEEQDVRHLRRGLDAGLAKAKDVLEESQANLAVARKDREVLIEQRRQEYKNAEILEEWLRRREIEKAQLAVELRGDLTRDEEMFLRTQISEKVEKSKTLQKANEESHKRLQAMEDAFTQLKQATGASSLEEMHEKFSSQKINKANLLQEVKDAEKRLDAAKLSHQKHEITFQELKSSGAGGGAAFTEQSKETNDELEESIQAAKNDFKVAHGTGERLSAVLLGLQQGATGLLQRVQPYVHLVEGGVFELTQMDEQLPWADTLDNLSTAEQVLAKMMEVLSGNSDGNNLKLMSFTNDDNEEQEEGDAGSVGTVGEAPSFAYNVRIKSKKLLRELESSRGDREKDDDSVQDKDKEKAFITAAAAGLDAAGDDILDGGGAISAPTANMLLGDDALVPTRQLVKKQSSRTTIEARRKAEAAIRAKRLAERMSMGAKGGGDDGIGDAAMYRAQRASADRLAAAHGSVNLPDGVTLRDDPMTKTKAFLSKMPQLL